MSALDDKTDIATAGAQVRNCGVNGHNSDAVPGPLLALSGRFRAADQCPLLGEERTSSIRPLKSANDISGHGRRLAAGLLYPGKRTLAGTTLTSALCKGRRRTPEMKEAAN